MPLSWNEISSNALAFSKDWSGAVRERSESQTFWNEFFEVFGLKRRLYATFEEPVKRLSGNWGFIDVFWSSVLLAEQKSLGKDLGKAESQAFDYIRGLKNSGRENEAPKYVIVSDFARIALHNLEPDEGEDEYFELPLHEFYKHIHRFAFIPGYKRHVYGEQDPINIKAVEILGRLHDELKEGGYKGHDLERFMVRVLFCLFAEDTGIFERDAFLLFILNRTSEDGSDLGIRIAQFFGVLNKPKAQRQKNLDEDLIDLPYVNGDLFLEQLGFASFNRKMRDALMACSRFDWSRISPAIFGSLFQSIMTPKDRRQIGAHYTSERDILKLIRGLFLDQLTKEFERIKQDSRTGAWRTRLETFHRKLCSLKFLDPACGCGNFLIITYRELRLLELEVLQELFSTQQELRLIDAVTVSQVDVNQMHGIEIQEWPAQIAEVALWLMDHQMNLRVSEVFGQLYQRLPLTKSPHIQIANALRLDWNEVLPAGQCDYVLGNPPFVGKKEQNPDQKVDMKRVWAGVKGAGILDYVTCWYNLAADYITGTAIRCAFVSTNSIVQGEHIGVFWNYLVQVGIKLLFAHRPFKWISEAKGKAHVHVVIIGFSLGHTLGQKALFSYIDFKGEPIQELVDTINPYLLPGDQIVVTKRRKPLSTTIPPGNEGSKPAEFGNLIIELNQIEEAQSDPIAKKYIRRLVGGKEMLYKQDRWCLWLVDAEPGDLLKSKFIRKRLELVKQARLASPKPITKKLAETPSLFAEIRQPKKGYLLIPYVSSEHRKYIPMDFFSSVDIIRAPHVAIPGADNFVFGCLESKMFTVWVDTVSGRRESRYQITTGTVYNTFPFPAVSSRQKAAVEDAANIVLNVRKSFTKSNLAELYNPLSMPAPLVKAHKNLDKAVDRCYRKKPFLNERERIGYLFSRYEKLTTPLTPKKHKGGKR